MFLDTNSSRGMLGSYESLVSIGAESVITSTFDANVRSPSVFNMENGNAISASNIANFSRSPINSISSLELSPGMDEVSYYTVSIFFYYMNLTL